MKAIILAAGFGRRMRPLTYKTHKTLLKVGERTVIQWIVDGLLENEITEITIVTGYLAEQLKSYLSETYPTLPIDYIHNERYATTNNIYSMALALEDLTLDRDILLIECDLIFEPAVIKRLLASPHPNVALVARYRSGMDGTVVAISDGVITDVITPQRQAVDFDFSDKYKTLNIYRFSRDFCVRSFGQLLTYYAQVIDDNAYYELVLGILIYLQREMIYAEVLEGEKWAEIDDPNDLDMARFIFSKSVRKSMLEQSHGGYWNYDLLDFCYLRNMYFPSSAVLSELKNSLPKLMQNYGSAQSILNRKLSYYLLCDEEHLTLLNGASQIYPLLQDYFRDKRILIPSPSFGEYARIFPQATLYFDEVGLHWESIIEQAKKHDVVLFVNPNNPTGSTVPTESIYEFAAAQKDKIVILDESFIEFSNQKSILTQLEEQPLPNVILLKSLSKVLGVPGVRLGYCYSSNATFKTYLKQNIPIWNMNAIAEHFLELILKHRTAIQSSFQKTISDRAQFAALLESIPLVEKVYPSGGNFLLVSLHCSKTICHELVESLLLQYKIYVKDVSNRFRGSTSYLRLAVRLPTENQQFVHCFRSLGAEKTLDGQRAR